MVIELNDEETAVLAHALQSYLSDLAAEISHTDSLEFRDSLKHERDVLQRIAQALGADGG